MWDRGKAWQWELLQVGVAVPNISMPLRLGERGPSLTGWRFPEEQTGHHQLRK